MRTLLPKWTTLASHAAAFGAGVLALYLAGPAVGTHLRRVGGHLAGLGGDTPLTTAAEIEQVVDALAADVVTRHAQALVGPTAPRKAGAR